jgi:hypothetical protein
MGRVPQVTLRESMAAEMSPPDRRSWSSGAGRFSCTSWWSLGWLSLAVSRKSQYLCSQPANIGDLSLSWSKFPGKEGSGNTGEPMKEQPMAGESMKGQHVVGEPMKEQPVARNQWKSSLWLGNYLCIWKQMVRHLGYLENSFLAVESWRCYNSIQCSHMQGLKLANFCSTVLLGKYERECGTTESRGLKSRSPEC